MPLVIPILASKPQALHPEIRVQAFGLGVQKFSFHLGLRVYP